MASLPPAQQGILAPPELRDGKDGQRQLYILVNWLRRRLVGSAPGTGPSLFSSIIGRGDTTSTAADGVEIVVISVETPVVYSAFTLALGGDALDSGGGGVARIRLGGTYGLTDGALVLTVPIPTTGFARIDGSASITANLATLVQVTLQSEVGQKAKFRGGGLSAS